MLRLLIYLIPGLFYLVFFFLLKLAGEHLLGHAGWVSWMAAALTLGIGVGLTPTWMRIANPRRDEGAIAARETEISKTLNEFSRALSLIADVEPLVDGELGKLYKTIQADRLVLMFAEGEDGPFVVQGQRGYEKPLLGELAFGHKSRLVRWLMVNESLLAVAGNSGVMQYCSAQEREILTSLNIDLVVPLIATNRAVGIILVGRQAGFAEDEIDFLQQLAPRLGLALQNALLLRQSRLRLRRLYRAERLATVGQLAAGAAHEIRNPLTSIRSTMQYLRRDFAADEEKGALVDELLSEVDRINHIIAGLLSFARPSDPVLEVLDLAELLRQTASLVETMGREHKVEVILDLDKGEIQGDPAQLKQVFLNLFLNAIQAMSAGGRLAVRMAPADGGWWVEVADNGAGIGEDELERIFDPFFTTKEEGTGLGLAICYGIVRRHGGEIDVESESGNGTTVKVKL